MKARDLIPQLEKLAASMSDPHIGECVREYIHDLKKADPNRIVQVSNGDCEDDGIYAPAKDGEIMPQRSKPFREGQPFPDDGHEWVRVGYLPRQQPDVRVR